jgi:hypothetical protein
LDHLVEPVRDEQHRPASLALPAHRSENALGEVGRQSGSDLVQHKELRLTRKRASEIDHPEHRQRYISDELVEVDAELHRVQLPPDGLHTCAGQVQVGRDSQIGHERGVLEHRREPDARGLRRRVHSDGLPVDLDRAAVGLDYPRQDLDERCLARAVRAQERVHLPRLDDDVGGPQRDNWAKALGQVMDFHQRFGHVGSPSRRARRAYSVEM